MLRRRRHDQTDDAGASHYRMREKLVSIGDDYWIENSSGDKVFKVNNKAVRVRETVIFEDAHGNELCKIQERKVRIRDSMEIEGPDGHSVAKIHKAMITPLRDRFVVKVGDGPDLEIQGNILDHEYRIGEGRDKIAEVSKRWFRIRDTYGVEIGPGQNDVVILAVTAALEMMTD
jgi:uncharacterized protein YxjI